MKKTILVALALLGAGVSISQAEVAFSVSFGNGYSSRHCAPVYRPPVCATPVAPVVVAPVYSAPVYSTPVYTPVYPAPVVVNPVVVTPRYHSYGHYTRYRHHGYPRHHYNPGYSRRGPSYCAPSPRRSVSIRW